MYTEIENRPLVNSNTLPHPPLQTVYPESIRNNNFESRILKHPSSIHQYSSAPIPTALPSIVHEPTNTIATIQNVPTNYNTYAQSYSTPVITSTYSNREHYSHTNSAAHEKVIVKVVKAPGWYLNDPNERRSYFDAVARGLLSENGLVYVNNVQKENTQLHRNSGNAAIGSIATGPMAAPIHFPKNIATSFQPQIQLAYNSGAAKPFNGINYCPCANQAYTQSEHVFQTQYNTQIPIQSHTVKKRSNVESDLYSGRSSYEVPLNSVGRLAGDNSKYQYNLASLRPQSQAQLKSFSQRSYHTQYRQ